MNTLEAELSPVNSDANADTAQVKTRSKNPATRNRTRDHLIAAAFYSQMLYQLSYSRLSSAVVKAVCPSGLRGWTQVPLARAAWVQIPQLSSLQQETPMTAKCSMLRAILRLCRSAVV